MSDGKIHFWFELTYAQYLTIPRSVLQSMPNEWQARFVQCLEELDERMDWHPKEGRYWVQLKDGRGRYVHDPLMDYDRGRREIEPRPGVPWDETRCRVCGWPLADSWENGCVVGNCSMRPRPKERADRGFV